MLRVTLVADDPQARITEGKWCEFVIDLPYVGGRARLEQRGYTVFSLCEFNDEN